MEHLLDISLTELAKLYRNTEVSPVEIVKATFERQLKVEPQLNAFISLTEKEALQQAKEAEKHFLRRESVHILTGIPFSAKDLFYTKDIRTTCASNILRNFKPDFTATAIKKLLENGAVMIGKNNMLEFAYGVVHPDFGKTNNPWDLSKTSGGSSSGSVAAVASGIGFFSLGTDTGGSIRIPASYCGVVGLKPTRGLVSTHGVFPLSQSLDHAGPIARNALDAALVIETISGCDSEDPYSLAGKITAVDIENFYASINKRIGILPERQLGGLTPDVRSVYKNTLKHVQSLGWEIEEITIPGWSQTEDIIMNVLLPEAAQIHKQWLDRKKEYATMTYHQIEMGMEKKAVDYLDGLLSLKKYTEDVTRLFKSIDFLLLPTVAFAAPAEDPVIGSSEEDEMVFTGPFNISGHPAVTINMGFTENGLPVGMQLVAPHFRDIELLQAAAQLEHLRAVKLPPLIGKGV
ncbi:amidase [Planococcus versutus]|uniref:Amidase domain-containing protein n=1 Tax=Planococcus versutus TaxID=1302659 RepID=A0A1B1RZ45_9BACL|nr:amidase [Planococcus versutus]ANU26210.1 hypothetical protein I858_004085 [Planococcus versutus]